MAKLRGWKEIAAHIGRSERMARDYSDRADDPMPVGVFLGRVEAEVAEIDAWVKRQTRTRAASGAK